MRLKLLLSVLALHVYNVAAQNVMQDGIWYYLNDSLQTASVSHHPNKYSDVVTVPSCIIHEGKTYVVAEIGDTAFFKCDKLSKVSLPPTIKRIGNSAFAVSNLQEINFPESINEIGKQAFARCFYMKEATFHSSFLIIRDRAFQGCACLRYVEFLCDSISCEPAVFAESGVSDVQLPSNTTTISKDMFADCYALHHFAFPKNILAIEDRAFGGCHGLKDVLLPDGIKIIGKEAFAACIKMESFYLPPSVEYVGNAFVSNPKLEHIYCYARNLNFGDYYRRVTLHVPKKLLKEYRKSAQGIFKEIVVAKPEEMPVCRK